MVKNVACTRGNLADLGFELGHHENGEQLFPADFICDVAIWDGRIVSVGVRIFAKNSFAAKKILAIYFFDGLIDDCAKQYRRASRHENNQRGHGGGLKLHCATLDGNFGALHAERTLDESKMLRNFFSDTRLVCVNGLAGCRRFARGIHNNFGRNGHGRIKYHRQVAIEQMRYGSADDVANGFRRNRSGNLFVACTAGRN